MLATQEKVMSPARIPLIAALPYAIDLEISDAEPSFSYQSRPQRRHGSSPSYGFDKDAMPVIIWP
jgi:hypothetical protein